MGNLQLITGYAGSGKTTRILERIVNTLTKEPDRRIILLVPEQASYNYEYQLTIHPAIGGILSVQVLSFQRLAWTVLQQTGGAAQTVLSDLGKLLILRQEILRADSDLAFLKGSANKPGYLQLLAEAHRRIQAIWLFARGSRRKYQGQSLRRRSAGSKAF